MKEGWFESHSFHHRDFSNINELMGKKKEQGVSISLALPALNVEKTLSQILTMIKSEFMEKSPLLDEIVVIDSHSSDSTADIARKLGVPVYNDDETLPLLEKANGKGEALWKSLYVTKGDIIVWIDSDIENIHPRFIYGLVGPLLKYPEIGFVKGYYKRPLKSKETVDPVGGGRVTEILIRPFLNLFYPELAGFVQPLAGEMAGRRNFLESVPFYTNYAVETGLLIKIWQQYGLDKMVQVNLETRFHYNQPLPELGKMSFAILQALFDLLNKDALTLKKELNCLSRSVKWLDGEHLFEETEILVKKRPPMKEVPDYQRKRG